MSLLTESSLLAGLLVFARLTGWAWFDPLVGRLPVAVRLLLAAALTLALAPGLAPPVALGLNATFLPMLALEFAWGAAMALAVATVFALARLVVLWTGHTASGGLLALTPDQTETAEAPWRALAGWLAVLAFLGAGGHLLVVLALRESFVVMPLAVLPEPASLNAFLSAAAWLFATGAGLALPLLALVLMVQFALFVLARTTPGLDMFSVGLGAGALGVLAAWIVLAPVIVRGVAGGLEQMSGWLGAMLKL